MTRGDRQRLLHIRTYCEDIEQFMDRFGRDFDTFTSDRAYFSAVAMCLLQIGELSNGLSDEFREATKDQLPWGMIAECGIGWPIPTRRRMKRYTVGDGLQRHPQSFGFLQAELRKSMNRNTAHWLEAA